VVPARYNPKQHYVVDWGTGGKHYSSTARSSHDVPPSVAAP